MSLKRGANLLDVLDRVLDKGAVIDVWLRLSVVGLELAAMEARLVVASVEMYLQHPETPGASLYASPPATARTAPARLAVETRQ